MPVALLFRVFRAFRGHRLCRMSRQVKFQPLIFNAYFINCDIAVFDSVTISEMIQTSCHG